VQRVAGGDVVAKRLGRLNLMVSDSLRVRLLPRLRVGLFRENIGAMP